MIDITNINCVYITPCGWCSKWDKKCDKKMYQLDESTDDLSIATIHRCKSESDHEWECCGISTTGTDYRCKKCGAHKTIKFDNPTPNYVLYNEPTYDNIPNCCKACSNHPSNGGSGICHCTLPYFEQSLTCPSTSDTTRLYS